MRPISALIVGLLLLAGTSRAQEDRMGYEKAEEDAQVLTSGGTSYIMVNLRKEGAPAPARPSGPPLLAPKARRELEEGQRLLNENWVGRAIEHLEKAHKMAPTFPEICYLLGVAYQRANKFAESRKYLEKAIALDARHQPSLNSLGALFLMQSDFPQSLTMLQRSLEVDPNSARTHWLLAMVRVHMREMPLALEHVEKAIQLSSGKQPEMLILRAQVLEALNRLPDAIAQWEEFLSKHPDRPETTEAKQRLARAKQRSSAADARGSSPLPAATPLAAVHEESKAVNVAWAPPDIDDTTAAVEPGVTCSLPQVLAAARSRVSTLVETLQSFTATETVQRRIMDAHVASFIEWIFEYQAQIDQPVPGRLAVSDFRVAKVGGGDPTMNSNGIPAMALIMHPFYADDFEMRCEGRATMAGQSAWVVYFRQRDDKQPRIRSYGLQARRFPARLKGRAWISANSGNVIRLETDLIKPIPEMKLTRDHMVIDYAPVKFTKRDVRLWLPSAVNFYTDVEGKRRHYLHLYDNFELFAVDTKYEIQKKEAPPDPPN